MGFTLFGKKRTVKPIFVGCCGDKLVRGIYVFQIDMDNGELLKKKFYQAPANPSCLFRRERFIYTGYKNSSGLRTDGGLCQYATMDLQFGLAGKVSDKGKTYVDCFVNEERNCAYAVDYYNGEVVSIPILKQKIVKVKETMKHVGSGVDPKRQAQAHPCFIDQTPDKQRLIVCDLGADEVVLYIPGEKGALTRDDEHSFKVSPGNGPKKVVFSPNGKYAYILNELKSTVSVYKYNQLNFEFVEDVDTYPKDEYIDANLAGDIVINPTGEYLFVSNCGHDSVSVFEIDSDNGCLKRVDHVDTDEKPAAMIMIDDKYLVVASQKGGSIESFELKRGESKGLLFETHFSYIINEPVCLVEGRMI